MSNELLRIRRADNEVWVIQQTLLEKPADAERQAEIYTAIGRRMYEGVVMEAVISVRREGAETEWRPFPFSGTSIPE